MNVTQLPKTLNADESAMVLSRVIDRMRRRHACPIQIAMLSERLDEMRPGRIVSTHWPLEREG